VHLAEIHVYPLKGARGIALDRADVLTGGLRHDRRFMLLAADGTFVTQRSHPALALVTTALPPHAGAATSLTIATPLASVEVSLTPAGRRTAARIWDDDVEALEIPGAAAEILSDHLGERVSLVFMPDDVVRPVEAPYGTAGDRVGFADGYPVLLATRASLADLNARLPSPGPMNRFRPNLVIEGGSAFEEEEHARVRVGPLTFRMPKRCSRCHVTVVDQATGAVGKEPLRTLAAYRTERNKVYFAQNLIPDGEGTIALGDAVTYLEPKQG
jgi:uncharacterized protein YcbX